MDDLVERNELYYKKFTNDPLTGEISGIENGSFKNGKKNGEWLVFFENGQIKYIQNYKDGVEHGRWAYYSENGQLEILENYKDGVPDGLWKYFNKDGSLKKNWDL